MVEIAILHVCHNKNIVYLPVQCMHSVACNIYPDSWPGVVDLVDAIKPDKITERNQANIMIRGLFCYFNISLLYKVWSEAVQLWKQKL